MTDDIASAARRIVELEPWSSDLIANVRRRVLAKISKAPSGCWEWLGRLSENGYGNLWVNRRVERAHRASYRAFVGSFSEDLSVCHKCDNPKCVNPEHLFVGTVRDNAWDRERKARGTSKFTPAQVIAIRRDRRPTRLVAEEYCVHPSTIRNVRVGRRCVFIPDRPVDTALTDHGAGDGS